MNESCEFELLMSVMHQEDDTLYQQSRVDSDLLVINQCDRNEEKEVNHSSGCWRIISTTARGLSRSRNMALEYARGEICQLCDDDEILEPDYKNIILNAYKELPDADVIVFNVNRINYQMKKTYYRIPEKRLAPAYRSYGSVMITFRRSSILKNQVHFNEMFGSGSQFGGGEDSLFLRDIRNAGLKIYEHPAVIATIDYGRFESKWFHGYDEKYFYNLGVFAAFNGSSLLSSMVWGLYSCWKLRREKTLSPWGKIYWKIMGMRGYQKGKISYEEFVKSYR